MPKSEKNFQKMTILVGTLLIFSSSVLKAYDGNLEMSAMSMHKNINPPASPILFSIKTAPLENNANPNATELRSRGAETEGLNETAEGEFEHGDHTEHKDENEEEEVKEKDEEDEEEKKRKKALKGVDKK